MQHFQTVGLKTVLLRVLVSIYATKMLAKESKLLSLRPLQFPWVCRQCFPLKWRKFFLRINLNIRQVMCRDRLPVEIFICFKDNFNTLVLRYISSRLITSIETRNVRFFTFQDICLFTERYDLSVILILVVAMYQEIL